MLCVILQTVLTARLHGENGVNAPTIKGQEARSSQQNPLVLVLSVHPYALNQNVRSVTFTDWNVDIFVYCFIRVLKNRNPQ